MNDLEHYKFEAERLREELAEELERRKHMDWCPTPEQCLCPEPTTDEGEER